MRLLSPLVLPLLLVVSGCGDGSESSAPAPATPSAAAPTAASPATSPDPAPTDDLAASRLADVALLIDGERIGLERACQGADASVVAVAADGRRVILVREEGLTVRLVSEDNSSVEESADVEQSGLGISDIYEATLDVGGQPTPVRIEVRQDVELETCPEL